MQSRVIEKAASLLESGACTRVLGWKTGEFFYDVTPAVFTSAEEVRTQMVYNPFCGPNLSKYLIAESRKEGKIAVFLKPCDTFSFVQLQKEHRIARDKVYAVGVQCDGMIDTDSLKALGLRGVTAAREVGDNLIVSTLYGEKTVPRREALSLRCRVCKSKRLNDCDEIIGEQGGDLPSDRFAQVEALEAMTPEERFAFWRSELSKCIRCNACRNVCPACSCEKCVFDNPGSGVRNKAAADSFEENLFHIIRAFHVAGRCTDCGECSRVCPQGIPLHLLNRKLIKDMNQLYGPYQAGADFDSKPPMLAFTPEDPEASIITNGRDGQ